MTIVVNAPNGASVQFPDGTDHATIDRVMRENFAQPDKYQQAATDERDALKARGIDEDAGYTRRLMHGATLGADSTVLAGLLAIPEAIRHGRGSDLLSFDGTKNLDALREGYDYAKAREDLVMDDARKNTGRLGDVAEIIGGAGTGAGLGRAGLSRFLTKESGVLARAGASAVDSAAIGGVSGAMEGNGAAERGQNALKGALAGGLVGGLLPLGFAAAKGFVSPIASNIKARFNPGEYAENQVVRGITESGKSAADIAADLHAARADGQDVYTLADALGNPGQRMLSTVARAPGEGRTAVVDALNSRQADQGRRLTGAFREGFDAPRSAEAERGIMSQAAQFDAGRNYAPVARETRPIDVSDAVNVANQAISPAANQLAARNGRVPTDLLARSGIESGEAVIADPIREAVKQARSYLAAPSLTIDNVGKAFRAKTNIDEMIHAATEKGQGGRVAALIPVRDALDQKLAAASPHYAQARDAYRTDMGRIDALDRGQAIGRTAGDPADAIAEYRGLQDAGGNSDPIAQQAFRRGYVDPQVKQIQNAAWTSNKAQPFTSDAYRQELDAFAAPGRGDKLQRSIARENTMFETRNQAMGGSRTVDNANDHDAMAVDPHVVAQVFTGNWHGALKSALAAGSNFVNGNTAEVRAQVANMLLQRAPNINAQALQQLVDQTVTRLKRVQGVMDALGRAGGAAAVAARPMQN